MFIKKSLILFFSFFLFTCNDTPVDSNDNEIPNSNVSYSKHIQPIFNSKCIICHSESPQGTSLKLTNYSNLITKPGIVRPNEPLSSVLYQRISGMSYPRMPLNQDTLTAKQIQGIKTWISEGARNN